MACPQSNIHIALCGHGKMGQLIAQLAERNGFTITDLEKCDAVIDFSHATCVKKNVKLAITHGKPLVMGTTGWEHEMDLIKKMIVDASGTMLYAPNFSMGVYFFSKLIQEAGARISRFPEYDVQGLEMHHKNKKDAPSGTAKWLASFFTKKLSMTPIRIGNVFGKHSFIFDSPYDTITLTHEAKGREGFAMGALACARWIVGKKGWLTLDDMYGR